MMRRLVGLALLGPWLTVQALAAGPGGILVSPVVADRRVSTAFSAPDALSDDARAVLQSGLLLTFTFNVDLRRVSAFWWDRTVASMTVGSSARYDNLTGVYQVSKLENGRVIWSDRTSDLGQARTWMTVFEQVSLVSDDRLEPNGEYYISVTLRSSPRRTLSLWPFSADEGTGRADFVNLR